MVGFFGGAVSRLSMAYSVIAAKSDSVFLLPAEISGCWELAPAVMAGAFSVRRKQKSDKIKRISGAGRTLQGIIPCEIGF